MSIAGVGQGPTGYIWDMYLIIIRIGGTYRPDSLKSGHYMPLTRMSSE